MEATLEATEEVSLGCMPSKRRRAVLDAAAWLRDVCVCVIGHSSSLVRSFKKPPLHKGKWPTTIPTPEDFDCYDDYKLALQELHHETNLSLVRRYSDLLNSNPGEAAHFLSSWFKKDSSFEIALTEEDSEALLTVQESLAAIAANLQDRADIGSKSLNKVDYQHFANVCKVIFNDGAPRTGSAGILVPERNTAENASLYSADEMNLVLTKIKRKKGSVHGPLAALKSEAPGFRAVTRALVNLGRASRLTSSLWATRKITPLHKAGPRIIRKITNLRPISLATDMANVQDGLWLLRCQHLLEAFSGPSQMGGKWDVVAVVLAVVLHLQLRQFQGLDSYVLFADLKHAYDTASKEAMLVACYAAGIVETEWQLLYDFFHMDSAVQGTLSSAMKFGAGIPQGRKFGVHAFTSVMTFLRDLLNLCCRPAKTILPDFACDAISTIWAEFTPRPSVHPLHPLLHTPEGVCTLLLTEPEEARRLAIHTLANLPTKDDRIDFVEACGLVPLGALMFVDDVVAVFPSQRAVTQAVDVGLNTYSKAFGAEFNYGATKTAVLPMFDAQCEEIPDLSCDTYKLLGVQLDKSLDLSSRADHVLRVGKVLFREIFSAATHAHLPEPIIAAAVIQRVEPVVLFAAELWPIRPQFYKQLDALQDFWAKTILRGSSRDLRGPLAVAMCGWKLRLSSKALMKAVMMLAKIEMLPGNHPTRLMLNIAQQTPGPNWWSAVRDLMNTCQHGPIPTIGATGLFRSAEVRGGQLSRAQTKTVLQLYKNNFVFPVLRARDDDEYEVAARKWLPAFNCRVADFSPYRGLQGWNTLEVSFGHAEWAFVKLNGGWPLWDFPDLVGSVQIETCPLCGTGNVTVAHVLVTCPGTKQVFLRSGFANFVSRAVTADIFIMSLFHSSAGVEIDTARIRYVGLVMRRVAVALKS